MWKAGLSVRRLGTSRREQGKGTGACAGKWCRPRAHRAGPASLLCPPARTLGLVVRFPAAAPHSAPADPGSYRRAGEVFGSGFPAASPGAQSACAAQPPRRDTRGLGAGPGGRAGADLIYWLRPRWLQGPGVPRSPLAFSPGATPGASYQQSLPCLGCLRESGANQSPGLWGLPCLGFLSATDLGRGISCGPTPSTKTEKARPVGRGGLRDSPRGGLTSLPWGSRWLHHRPQTSWP